jgi:pSer/pThr/pTyr-binding forkhead associated (FHA) protein
MQAALIGPSGQTILGPAGLTIGRMQSNQLVVYDRRVSARHAAISSLKQGYYTITDIGSTNGTFVNGLTLTHNVLHILHTGDTIRLGDTILAFQISDKLQRLASEKMIADDLSNVKRCIFKISKESENFAAAKISFIGLSGQLVTGTMMLVKGSNDTWKIDDLHII